MMGLEPFQKAGAFFFFMEMTLSQQNFEEGSHRIFEAKEATQYVVPTNQIILHCLDKSYIEIG